ncbi:hypothetical protein ACFYZI_40760 [Streptomyces griseorubiginosus]
MRPLLQSEVVRLPLWASVIGGHLPRVEQRSATGARKNESDQQNKR